MHGFIQNGVHSSDMGVRYIPDAVERGDFYPDFEVLDFERSWGAGGEYFHSRVTTRTFVLSCYYDEITIAKRESIIKWLDRRSGGELIFDDRPYAIYYVHPTKKIEFKDQLQKNVLTNTDHYSGTFSITFSAYNPFAKLNDSTLPSNPSERMLAETGLLRNDQMPPLPNLDSTTSFLIYNPGTEWGYSTIRFSGSVGSEDMKIQNVTTGDVCVLKAGLETYGDDYIEINSKTGRVELFSGSEHSLHFAFHDEGYIRLVPHSPIFRDVIIDTYAGSRSIHAPEGTFNQQMVGQYMFVEGAWKLIGDFISSKEVLLSTEQKNTESGVETNVVTMNYIVVEKASDANIARFEMICEAEVR